MKGLLAVDLGIKTGLALFSPDGRLLWCRSHNLGNMQRLKRAVYNILRDIQDISHVVIEGGGPVADVWKKQAQKLGLQVIQITAEQWRQQMLHSRQRTDSSTAKRFARKVAKEVVKHSPSIQYQNLRDDTAEAVLIGLWAFKHLKISRDQPE